MTHATKAVMKLLLSDNIKLQFKQNPLYNEKVRRLFNVISLAVMYVICL